STTGLPTFSTDPVYNKINVVEQQQQQLLQQHYPFFDNTQMVSNLIQTQQQQQIPVTIESKPLDENLPSTSGSQNLQMITNEAE
uniref:Uncharacterized protein n=1 Tax=Panagrolaimus sp. PS1159 TaxID=55785 RepID=A0AC35GMQ9_9BILA